MLWFVARITEINEGGVRGFLHWPDAPTGEGLVLTHGAGSNCAAPLLVEIAQAACTAGITVLRCDLPFRQRRAYGPPLPAGAEADRAGLHNAGESMQWRHCAVQLSTSVIRHNNGVGSGVTGDAGIQVAENTLDDKFPIP